jgi:dipeptidyl aminopeptidase/acylaminoacyl peptidase
MPAAWSPDSARIYFQVARHGNSQLYSVSPDGTGLAVIVSDVGVIGAFSFDERHSVMAYFRGSATDPGQVVVRSLENGSTRVLAKVELGNIEETWFKDAEGGDLQGWILKPPGFDATRKYPAILEIHGGPHLQYGSFFMHEFQFLAAHDYVVFYCNPRGGQGYGEKHALAIENDWGGADYDDLMAWTDFVLEKPYIDASRVGVTGGSYGGFMTNWIIGHTNRFRAAVTQRCVSNMISMYGSSDFNWSFEREMGGRPPWDDVENYWRQSPMKYIGNAKTPTLVIHNENDLRCAIEQGEQVFTALKRLGVETAMVRFPDEFHGLSRSGRTDRRIERLNSILGWFDKYLK